jgi:hypothetical protein
VLHCAAGGCLCGIVPEYPSAITPTSAINSVIVVVISHILSAIYLNSNESSGSTSGCNGGILLAVPLVAMEGYYWQYLWLQWRYITGSTCGCNGGILLAVPLVAMEGYYWQYLWLQWRDITQNSYFLLEPHLHKKCKYGGDR